MARYNEILSARYNRHLQKLFSMKGEPPAPQLASEISANILLFGGHEEHYLLGWQHYSRATTVVANAGFASSARLRNPSTSGVIAVVELLSYTMGPADTALGQHGPQAADLANISAAQTDRWDPRGNQQPSCVFSFQSTAAAGFGGAWWQAAGIANTVINCINSDNQEIILFPGEAIQMASSAVNITVNVSMKWRERTLETSELT